MSKVEAWKTWEGRVVEGKYSLRQWLGGSDHSAVFLTDRPGKPAEKAAIKLTEFDGEEADREVERLRAAAKLSHPHLISIYDAGRTRIGSTPLVYVVMEYAEEDLSQILPQRPLTPAEVSEMLSPLLDGLSDLHSMGLVHGRLKPSNVLVVSDQLKLSTDQVTSAGEPAINRRQVGVYDAPESSSGTVSPPADVWSLGVTIVAALTQKATPAAQVAENDPAIPGNLPEPFRGITRDCLHLDPSTRCTIAEIRTRLQPVRRAATPVEPERKRVEVTAQRKPEPRAAELPPEKKSDASRLPVFVIPLVIVVVVLAAWGLFHSKEKDSSAPAADTSQPATSHDAAPLSTTIPKPDASNPAKKAVPGGGSVLHQVMPDIPQSAKNTISGTIKITARVEVDASGKVTSAKLKSAGPSKYFAGKVLKASEDWQFAPPQSAGQPTSSAWLLHYQLKRSGVQASSERVSR
jgi:TonB family protein